MVNTSSYIDYIYKIVVYEYEAPEMIYIHWFTVTTVRAAQFDQSQPHQGVWFQEPIYKNCAMR